jgi:hypothetical protein
VSAAVADDVAMVAAGYKSALENSCWTPQEGLVSGLACQWSRQRPYWPCRSCLKAEAGEVRVHVLERGCRFEMLHTVDFVHQGALMCGIEWC